MEESHDLGTVAVDIGAEGVAGEAERDPLFHCPKHGTVVESVRIHIREHMAHTRDWIGRAHV